MPRLSGTSGAITLVIFGMFASSWGASIAVLLFPEAGPLGMSALRLTFSAAILMLIARPKLRGYSRRAWGQVFMLGVSLAVMNSAFYLAIERLALGVAVTIEVLGPLALAVATARRRIVWLWAGIALIGVAALGGGGWDRLDVIGVALVLIAAVFWACYIYFAAKVGKQFPKLDGLALAMVVGAAVTLPFGVVSAGATLIRPEIIGLGLVVALLSSTMPYAFEMLALRRITPAAFGILMSLAPAISALAGFMFLGQNLTIWEGLGMALVIVASAGAVWMSREHVDTATGSIGVI
jgi:inner membrane transporter RhtA